MNTSDQSAPVTNYKPSAYYFRRALRSTDDPHRLRAVGLEAVSEMEHLKAFIRSLGYVPPRKRMLREEAVARASIATGTGKSAS